MTNPMLREEATEKLNRFFACIVIPVIGILIPNFSGLISNDRYPAWQLLISYAYFVITALMIWKGNLIFFENIRKKFRRKSKGYFKMIISYLSINLLYSAIISILFFCTWQIFSNGAGISWIPVFYATSVVLICVTIINNIYEIVLLRTEMEAVTFDFRKVEIQKMQAELEALKAHIDPHFIFNSLNTLSYLIVNKPELAKTYNETLARVYRYILFNKENDLVFLKEELDFIRNYFYLVSIRFNNAIEMRIDIPDEAAENYLLTPVSLQLLLENAIKHNHFSATSPLLIKVGMQSHYVTVVNRVRKKEFQYESTGIGLKNLQERFQLIIKKDIISYKENNDFIVKLPVLKA